MSASDRERIAELGNTKLQIVPIVRRLIQRTASFRCCLDCDSMHGAELEYSFGPTELFPSRFVFSDYRELFSLFKKKKLIIISGIVDMTKLVAQRA